MTDLITLLHKAMYNTTLGAYFYKQTIGTVNGFEDLCFVSEATNGKPYKCRTSITNDYRKAF